MPNKYNVGIHNVGSYQISGWPWITGSVISNGATRKISFPMVTKSITIIASGTVRGVNDGSVMTADLRIHCAPTSSAGGSSANGGVLDTGIQPRSNKVLSGHHYISLYGHGDSFSSNVKCKEIYISVPAHDSNSDGGYELFAEMTNIPASQMYPLTGSGVDE